MVHSMSYFMSALFGLHALFDGVVERPRRPALAHDLRGDALSDFALTAPSAISDSVDQLSMLMNPGETASPLARQRPSHRPP